MVLVDFVDEKDEPIVLVRLLFLKLVKHTNHIRVNNRQKMYSYSKNILNGYFNKEKTPVKIRLKIQESANHLAES